MGCDPISWLPLFSYAKPQINEDLKRSIQPKFRATFYGPQIVSPNSPYIAAAGQNYLYFIDERFDIDEASFIKKQIEMSIPLDKEGHIYFDDEKVIVERRDSQNKTFFTFSPAYGRVWFAETFNKIRPDPQRGNWLAHYEIPKTLTDEDKARKDVRLDDIELGNKETSGRAIDVPRYQDETDAQYYKRMDDLHWR